MTSLPTIALFLTVWATLVRALALTAQPERATCPRCGFRFQRARLGDRVCVCG